MKTAVQMIGLVRGTPGGEQKHRANGRGIFAEMGEERATHSETYDPSRTEMNVYDQEDHSGIDVWDEMDQESREYKMLVHGKTKTGEEIIRERSLRKDAVIGVAIIINPPYEDTKDWTVSDYEQFYKDTNDTLAEFCPEIFRAENKKFGVRHLDEGHPEAEGLDEHKHEVFSCIDQDGKYCGNKIDARFLSDFNKFYPQAMRDRGWTQMEDLETTDWDRMKTDPEYQVYRAKKLGGQRLTTNEVLHQAAEKKYERAEEELESAVQANIEAQGLKSEAESMVSDAEDKVKQMNGELEDAKSEKLTMENTIKSMVKDVDSALRVDKMSPKERETYDSFTPAGKADLLRQVVHDDAFKMAQLEKDIPELESRNQTLESKYVQQSKANEELKNKNVNLETVVIPQNQQKAEKIISDANTEAQKIKSNANDQAEEIVSEANDQAETIKFRAETETKQLNEKLPWLRTEKKTLEGDIKGLEQRKENLGIEIQGKLDKAESEASETIQKASEQADKIIGEAYQVKYHTVHYPTVAAAYQAMDRGEVNRNDIYMIYPDSYNPKAERIVNDAKARMEDPEYFSAMIDLTDPEITEISNIYGLHNDKSDEFWREFSDKVNHSGKCPVFTEWNQIYDTWNAPRLVFDAVNNGDAVICADVPEDRVVVPKTVFNKIIDCLDRMPPQQVVKDFIDKFKSSDPDRNHNNSWSEPDGHGVR